MSRSIVTNSIGIGGSSVRVIPIRLLYRIELCKPDRLLETTVNGPDFTPVDETMEVLTEEPSRTAYANLIVEMLNNRPMLFIRDDEAEKSWRVCDPIATAWAEDEVPMQTYPAGGEPPTIC